MVEVEFDEHGPNEQFVCLADTNANDMEYARLRHYMNDHQIDVDDLRNAIVGYLRRNSGVSSKF